MVEYVGKVLLLCIYFKILEDFETVNLKYKKEDFMVHFFVVKPICTSLESWATLFRQYRTAYAKKSGAPNISKTAFSIPDQDFGF